MHSHKYNSGLLGRYISSLCVFLCVAFTSLGQNSNVEITSLVTSGGSWSELLGGVYTFMPTSDNANVKTSDIINRLDGSGFTRGSVRLLTTNATGTQVGTVQISHAIFGTNSGGSEYTFSIAAKGDIRVSSAINLIGGSWNLGNNKGYHVNFTSEGNILVMSSITTSGEGSDAIGRIVYSSAGSITLNATGYVNTTSSGIITAAGGVNSSNPIYASSEGGSVIITGLAGLTLRSNISTINGNAGLDGYGRNGSLTLNIDNAVLTTGSGLGVNDGQVSGQISGGNLTKSGVGLFVFNTNVNNYRGSTIISAGTLRLGASANILARNSLSIGSSGVLDMSDYSLTVSSLAGLSGSLVTSSGSGGSLVLTMGSDGESTSYAGGIENGRASSISLVKNGIGVLTLSGLSSYSGTTLINGGRVNVRHSNGLGVSSLVSVASGAALELQNNVSIPALSLRLTGTGIMSRGALRNISGDNSWAGAIALVTSTVSIASDAGTMSLTSGNSINAGNINVDFIGNGNVQVLGSITTGTGSLSKSGNGNLTLSGVNSYTGVTDITGGFLSLGANNVIHDLSTINFRGGTLRTNGFSDNFGPISLVSSSAITLGAGSHQINFTSLASFSASRLLTITGWTGVFTPTSDTQLNTFGKLETTSLKFVSNRGVIMSTGLLNQFGKIAILGPSGTGGTIFIHSTLTAAQLNQIKVINSTDASTHFATQLDSNEIVPNYAQ